VKSLEVKTKELPNIIPSTPIAKRLRNRLSHGMCRQDGKFYPNQYDLRLIADVERLEKFFLSSQGIDIEEVVNEK
jgi:hypothetical protein